MQIASFLYDFQLFTLSRIVLYAPLIAFETTGPLSTVFHISPCVQLVSRVTKHVQSSMAFIIYLLAASTTSILFYRFQAKMNRI